MLIEGWPAGGKRAVQLFDWRRDPGETMTASESDSDDTAQAPDATEHALETRAARGRSRTTRPSNDSRRPYAWAGTKLPRTDPEAPAGSRVEPVQARLEMPGACARRARSRSRPRDDSARASSLRRTRRVRVPSLRPSDVPSCGLPISTSCGWIPSTSSRFRDRRGHSGATRNDRLSLALEEIHRRPAEKAATKLVRGRARLRAAPDLQHAAGRGR